jgi:hypothetical protein
LLRRGAVVVQTGFKRCLATCPKASRFSQSTPPSLAPVFHRDKPH